MIEIQKAIPTDSKLSSRLIGRSIIHSYPGYYSEFAIRWKLRYYSPRMLEGWIRKKECWVAHEEKNVLGVLVFNKRFGFGRALFIDPVFMKQGAGSMLLEKMEEVCRGNGRKRVWLISSKGAIRFYEKKGYRRVVPGFRFMIKALQMKTQ